MDQQAEQIREQQKESWDKFSGGWEKWDDLLMSFMDPVGNEIIAAIQPHGNDVILDIAAGTGEPGFTIASMLTGGKVIITDVSDKMLHIAQAKARQKGITNIETVVCDVCELPFEDNAFDAISCRFGFMFFPDMLLAAKEMARVLKPGGKISAAVWDIPDKNFWVTAIMGVINKNMQLPSPPPGSPGMFRCAKDGFIADLFEQAGLKNISQKHVAGKLNTGTTDIYWTVMNDVGAPIVAALSKADDAMKDKIKQEVFENVLQKYPEGEIFPESGALVISAEK